MGINHYTRHGVFRLDEVLPYVVMTSPGQRRVRADRQYGDWIVDMASPRYQMFAAKGTRCVCCGLEAEFFALEQDELLIKQLLDTRRCHLNLYGVKDGQEVLFTKDHIVPRSRGGRDRADNYQPMCAICNNKKGAGEQSAQVTCAVG